MSTIARALELSESQSALLHEASVGSADAAEEFARSVTVDPVRLSAEVLSVKRVPSGAGVSYGHTFRTANATTLALIAIGYGHGVPRKAGNRAQVTWTGPTSPAARRFSIVGRVAMDVLVVDAADDAIAAGERVVLFGNPSAGEISLGEWAASVGEHPATVAACLDYRVRRAVHS